MIHRNLPITDYHAHAAISNSKLKDFRQKGPAFFKRKFIDRTIREKRTDALVDGAAFDCFLTEPDSFVDRYVIKPETYTNAKGEVKKWNGNAGECRQWKAANADKEILDADAPAQFEKMRESLKTHPLIGPIIGAAATEMQVSLRHLSSVFGLEMQTRPDFFSRFGCDLSGGKPFIADLKTCADFSEFYDWADPQYCKAIRPVVKYGYHRQAALAQHVCIQDPEIGKVDQFLIVVEKAEPFRCGIFRITEETLDIGFQGIERDLHRLKRCMDSGEWPNSPASVIDITAPVWLQEAGLREWESFQDETERAQAAGNAIADAMGGDS